MPKTRKSQKPRRRAQKNDPLGSFQLGTLWEYESDRRISTKELNQAIFRNTLYLYAKGVQKGDVVILQNGNSIQFFVDLFALWKLGAIAAPLHPKSKPNEIENLVRFTKAKLILSERTSQVHPIKLTRPFRAQKCSLNDPCLLLLTSGSTSPEPKIVVHNYRSISNKISLLQKQFQPWELKRTLCFLPTSFGHGLICNCLLPLLTGNELILSRIFDIPYAMSFDSILKKTKPTFLSSVPAFWNMLIMGKVNLSKQNSLRRIHCASSPMQKNIWDFVQQYFPKVDFRNVYGITELAGWIGMTEPHNSFQSFCVGKIFDGQIRILRKKPHDESGEIQVRSKSLMMQYWGHPKLPSTKWFHTGDMGYLDSKSNLFLRGRSKNVINTGGTKIYAEEIDQLIVQHPSVQDACSFGLEHPIFGEVIAIAIVLRPHSNLQEIKKWCQRQLNYVKVPRKWYVVDSLPRNERGKVNRDHLKKMIK